MSDSEQILTAPLDAYATAKPDEPTWTVQGGDPLGAPLLRVWAAFARLQAGAMSPGLVDGIFAELLKAANNNPPPNDQERRNLLIRATQTEEVSWDFDSYFQGGFAAEDEAKTPPENSLSEIQRLDLFDARVRYAQKVSGMIADLVALRNDLTERGFFDSKDHNAIYATELALKSINQMIEPRRLMKDRH